MRTHGLLLLRFLDEKESESDWERDIQWLGSNPPPTSRLARRGSGR
jgi:hypothetical protein